MVTRSVGTLIAMQLPWARAFEIQCSDIRSAHAPCCHGSVSSADLYETDACYLDVSGAAARWMDYESGISKYHHDLRRLKIASSAFYNEKCSPRMTNEAYDALKAGVLGAASSGKRIAEMLACAQTRSNGATDATACSDAQLRGAFETAQLEDRVNLLLMISHHAFGALVPAADRARYVALNDVMTEGILWASGSSHVDVLQWNTHWQCWTNEKCANFATASLEPMLAGVDFANLIEFESSNITDLRARLPGHEITCWQDDCAYAYSHTDKDMALVVRSKEWEVLQTHWIWLSEGHDRACTLQQLHSPARGMTLWFVGAHFADYEWYESSARALHEAFHAFNVSGDIIVAMDSNMPVTKSSDDIAHDLALPRGVKKSLLIPSCCFCEKEPFDRPNSTFTFDRILTTFGKSVALLPTLDTADVQAQIHGDVDCTSTFGTFHLPVKGRVQL